MQNINFFHPYSRKELHHEDQLTWSFFVLLKYCPSVFVHFLDTIKKSLTSETSFPNLIDVLSMNLDFQTQIGSPSFETSYLLSVLLTNDELDLIPNLIETERNAVYDGVITLGDELTIIVETKPNKQNVWEEQLSPSTQHYDPKETHLIRQPVIITWKGMIKWLNEFSNSNRFPFSERLMTGDFLTYINDQYGALNPFDRFHLCKGNQTLIYKRIEGVLNEVVNRPEIVKYHYGWGFYIETPYGGIRKIGMIWKDDHLELTLIFGDTQGQAIKLYPVNFDLQSFNESGWNVFAHFHLAFMRSNKVWFGSPDLDTYINYWNEHASGLHQQQGHDVLRRYLSELEELQIIKVDQAAMDQVIYGSRMDKINICPSLAFIKRFSLKELEDKDRNETLADEFHAEIKACLESVIGVSGDEILRM